MATLEQLIIFFLLIGVGVIARKVGVITPETLPNSHLLFLTLRCQPLYFPG